MPTVNKQRFLRIQPSNDPWIVGLKCSFGSDLNKMTRDWRQNSNLITHPATCKRAYANEIWVEFQHALVQAKERPDAAVKVLTVLAYLEGCLKATHDSLLAVRELVFENVRRKEFNDLPSRHTCLYLCPDRRECVRYWWNELVTQGHDPGKTIWDVIVTGEIFLTPDLVKLQSMSVEEWEALARRYWSPHDAELDNDEILFAGEIEVVAERQKADFGIP